MRVRSALCEPWAYRHALTLHRLSASTASLHVAPYGGFTTMLNPRQILAFAPRQDVRFWVIRGHFALRKAHVRSTPESGHVRCD